jgi:hypothetical protein
MIPILAFRHLLVKKTRSVFLLLGYGLGVGVMIVLLSVGRAMVEQSQEVSLVGGGDVTVLPQGIDVEATRTGGASGMFFGIDRARFVTRQLLGGRRHAGVVRAVSPAIEKKLLYLAFRGETLAVRAGGDIPSRAAAMGAGLRVLDGAWADTPSDSAWITPTTEQLYHEMDRFHIPPTADPGWGEWHYFNVTVGPAEWWYITYLVAGPVRRGRWGGQLLIGHRKPDGSYDRFTATFPARAVSLDTARADLALGANVVRQRGGVYGLVVRPSGDRQPIRLDLRIQPEPDRYFPPVDLRAGEHLSGYVVPALSARATGTICEGDVCQSFRNAAAYHDHNWGVWRNVTWDWGAARGRTFNLLYGAVRTPDDARRGGATGEPRLFVTLVDSLGVRQILRARDVRYARSSRRIPDSLSFIAVRDNDTVRFSASIGDAQESRLTAAGVGRVFLQMRGRFRLQGTLDGEEVRDQGTGFFETYVEK